MTASSEAVVGFTKEELAALVGRPVPGGTYTVEPWRAWLVGDVVGARPGGDLAHPLFVYLATVGSMGWTWDELFEICGARAADGPMFGESETLVHVPLRVGATYGVYGRIATAERKRGRRAGVFDVVGLRLELRDEGGVLVAESGNSVVFPRASTCP